jgi:hypothetical protein
VDVGGGLIVVGVVNGFQSFSKMFQDDNTGYERRAVTFSVIGAVGVLSSLPLFRAAHVNKKSHSIIY